MISASLAGTFLILIAILRCLAAAQGGKHEAVQAWFGAKWIAINNGPWLSMPETVIKWLIHVKNVTSQSLLTNADKLSDTVWFGRTALLVIPILAVSGSSLYWGFYGAMVSVSSSVIWAFGISASLHRLDDNPFRPRHHFRTAPLDPVIRLLGRVGAVGWKQTGALFALWFGGFTGAAAVAWVLIVLGKL